MPDLPDFKFRKKSIGFPNEVFLAWLIYLILLKSLIFTSSIRNRGKNTSNVKIKFRKFRLIRQENLVI